VRTKTQTRRAIPRDPFHVLLSKSERAKLTRLAKRANVSAADMLRHLIDRASA